ncbi:MAG: ribulokinase, partial [Gluconacetobacter diazotrophicus]|nr:ribulokinase [Gluconacetobacter diazotrophicus]
FPTLREEAERHGETVYERLNARLDALARDLPFPALLAEHLHVLPDHHGNRSPRADAAARGLVSGLSLSAGPDDLAILYLATVQGLAYGTRHIVEAMNDTGYRIDTVLASGGGTKNPVFLREHANATGCRIVLPREPEAVLLGAAMLGAVSAGLHPDLRAAMAAMSGAGATVEPAGGEVARFHERKYRVFRRMIDDQLAYRALMTGNPLSDPP